MPHGLVAIEMLNQMFATKGGDPELVLGALRGATTLPEVYERLEIQQGVGAEANRDLQRVFAAVPASLQAGMLAAATSAVERGLGVTFAWKQSVAFELGAWEAVDEESGAGGLTMLISTPLGRSLG